MRGLYRCTLCTELYKPKVTDNCAFIVTCTNCKLV